MKEQDRMLPHHHADCVDRFVDVCARAGLPAELLEGLRLALRARGGVRVLQIKHTAKRKQTTFQSFVKGIAKDTAGCHSYSIEATK